MRATSVRARSYENWVTNWNAALTLNAAVSPSICQAYGNGYKVGGLVTLASC